MEVSGFKRKCQIKIYRKLFPTLLFELSGYVFVSVFHLPYIAIQQLRTNIILYITIQASILAHILFYLLKQKSFSYGAFFYVCEILLIYFIKIHKDNVNGRYFKCPPFYSTIVTSQNFCYFYFILVRGMQTYIVRVFDFISSHLHFQQKI